MVLNALVLSHHLCELRCYPPPLPSLFLFSLCFYSSYQGGIAFNSVVVLLWHQQLAQQYLLCSQCCSWGIMGQSGVTGREGGHKCDFYK